MSRLTQYKVRILRLLWSERPDTSELLGALIKVNIGWMLFLQSAPYHLNQMLSDNYGVTAAALCAWTMCTLGVATLGLWLVNNCTWRRHCAMAGIMLWLFLASLENHIYPNSPVMFFFLLLSFNDILIYLRLRTMDGS